MAMTIRALRAFLEKAGMQFLPAPSDDVISIVFAADMDRNSYRCPDGSLLVPMLIQLHDEGRFMSLSVPNAWNVSDSPHKHAVFEALLTIQAMFPAVRFDYSPETGEVRPNIEMCIEDSRISSRQLFRSISGILQGLSKFDASIVRAMTCGEITVADVTMDERWGEYEEDDAESASTKNREAGESTDPFMEAARKNRDSFDSTAAARLRTVLAIAQHEGGLDAVDRLLARVDKPPPSPAP